MNTLGLLKILVSSLWALASCGITWYIMISAKEITYITLADGRRQARVIPILFKLLLPLAPNLFGLFSSPNMDKTKNKIYRQLTASGYDDLISVKEFLALKILTPVIPGTLWLILTYLLMQYSQQGLLIKLKPAIMLIGPLMFAIMPDQWLRKAVKKRHLQIQKDLPFTLDLLTLAVEAGMDFMSAIQRNVEHDHLNPLDEELIRVLHENQLGKTRREALKSMSERVNLPELKSVVNALVQADELGVSIGSILKIQSEQMRQKRFERAEKLAQEAPVKMLFPLLCCIFPAVILILMGPIILSMLKQVS